MDETDTALPGSPIDMFDALGLALPVIVLACLAVVFAMLAVFYTFRAGYNPPAPAPSPARTRRDAKPTPLARADAALDRAGVGPFWRLIFFIIALVYLALFLLALGATTIVLWEVLFATDPATTTAGGTDGMATDRTGGAAAPSLGLGALLAVFLGAPFLIWRTLVAQGMLENEQNNSRLEESARFNDRIAAAAAGLSARREKTLVVGRDKDKRVLSEQKDDLEIRVRAIDQLEALAKEALAKEPTENDQMQVPQRIARMLSIYVQELSRKFPAENAPDYHDKGEMRKWAATLRPIARPDMERAVQSLGRINPEDDKLRAAFDPSNIDLRRCNLQGFELISANLRGVQLGGAQMQGSLLREAKLNNASLSPRRIEGHYLKPAQMQGADLTGADLRGTDLTKVNLQACRAIHCKLQGTTLHQTDLRGAGLGGADLRGAWFVDPWMDRSTQFDAPDNELSPTRLEGAGVSILAQAAVTELSEYFDRMFGDSRWRNYIPASPHGPRPQGPTDVQLDDDDFTTAWRAWAAEHHDGVVIAPDWHADPDAN